MARRTANSLLNSLKSKIWLATSALAFFICSFGLVSYLIVASLTNDTFYAVFILFTVMAFSVMVFGWWLSNELISPIEKVSLLAKSLERGTTASLPRTTGSTETDEILSSLHRSNQQLAKSRRLDGQSGERRSARRADTARKFRSSDGRVSKTACQSYRFDPRKTGFGKTANPPFRRLPKKFRRSVREISMSRSKPILKMSKKFRKHLNTRSVI